MKSVVLLSLIISTGLAFSQSVADAAKAKPTKKASRVITNDEIPSKPQEDPKPAQAGAAAEATANSDEKPAAKTDAEAASKPSAEVQDMEKQLTDLNSNIAARKKRTDEYREKMQSETDEHRKEIEQEVLSAMEGDIQSMQKESEDLQKKIDDKKQADKEKPKEATEPKESGN